jgi:hypothetical protein
MGKVIHSSQRKEDRTDEHADELPGVLAVVDIGAMSPGKSTLRAEGRRIPAAPGRQADRFATAVRDYLALALCEAVTLLVIEALHTFKRFGPRWISQGDVRARARDLVKPRHKARLPTHACEQAAY